VEIREIWALRVTPDQVGFYGAAQVARIHRHFLTLRTGKETDETVLVITGLTALSDVPANGTALLEIARGHWSIENGNHYVRDRSYDEDRCQVREPNSAQILTTLRSLARFLAKQGAHHPRNPHQQTTPALHRFCNAHRNQALHWLLSPRGFR
jgi:predicted transposase YbfD/YdcC